MIICANKLAANYTSRSSVHALKKRRLQIKPESGLYTATEFRS